MTVSSTTTRNSYTGDGTTTVFAYTFKIFDDDDITVILRTTATGTETVQTKTTDYSVSGVGDTGGGNITFVTPPTAAQTVVLLRQTAQTQTTDYTPNDPFPAASHEDALDKMTLIIQDQQDELDRAIKLSRTNTMTSTEFTVGASDRANKILAFDSSGELAVTQEIGTFTGDWASGTSYQQRDIIKDTSNDNIYIANTAHTSSGSEPISSNTDSAKWDLLVDAAAAATSATAAASSATAAAASATAAAASESAAATSETNAATSETNAATSESNASTSATNAATSATAAAASETAAAASETAAAASETAAAASETAAAASETAAAASESAAATSETNAATSETNAATSETNAATSETNAATSATNAATSATAASTAQTAAEAARDAIQQFYLGAQTSNPTVDGNGDPVTDGDWYFNTTDNTTRIYDGSAWNTVAPDLVGDATPQLGGNLDTNGNDINFGDNDKAVFGAGSDLQIYHDGTNSRIADAGTGNLYIEADGQFRVIKPTTEEVMIKALTDGAVTLYYDNAEKLATTSGGIDVTGTVTSDGLYVNDDNGIVFDGPTSAGSPVVYVARNDSTTNSGNTLGEIMFTSNDGVTGSDVTTETDAPVILRSTAGENHSTTNRGGDFRILTKANGTANSGNATQRVLIYNNGDISFYDSTGVTQGFYWDASEVRLGLGTTSPARNLHLYAENADASVRLQNTANSKVWEINPSIPGVANSGLSVVNVTDNTVPLHIDNSGNVGIGTASVDNKLHLEHAGSLYLQIENTSTANKFYLGNSGGNAILESTGAYSMNFKTNSTERMRIDSSGNLLVGYTSSNGAYKLQVNSQIFATSATIATSDGNYKENITPLDGALSLVSQLNPVQFDWKEHPVHEFDRNQPTIGFIAQEVQQVLAEQPYLNSIVKSNECVLEPEETDDEGNVIKEAVTEPFLGIAEGNMVALLTAAIKEQQATITALEARIAALEAN